MRVRLATSSRPRTVGGLALRPGVWTAVPDALRLSVVAEIATLGRLVVVDDSEPRPLPPAPVEAIQAPPSPRRRTPRADPIDPPSEPAPEAEG